MRETSILLGSNLHFVTSKFCGLKNFMKSHALKARRWSFSTFDESLRKTWILPNGSLSLLGFQNPKQNSGGLNIFHKSLSCHFNKSLKHQYSIVVGRKLEKMGNERTALRGVCTQ